MEKINSSMPWEEFERRRQAGGKIGGLVGVTETAYEAIIWCLRAYPRSSALVLMLSVSIIRYL
jgi:hypothetical protein